MVGGEGGLPAIDCWGTVNDAITRTLQTGPLLHPYPPLKWDLGSLTSGSGKHLSKQIGPAGRRRRGSAAQAVASAPVWLGALGSSPGAEASRPNRRSDCRCPAGAAPNLSRSIIATAAFSFCGSVSGGGATLLIPLPNTPGRGAVTMCHYLLFLCAAPRYSCAPLLLFYFVREWASGALSSHSTLKEPLRWAAIGCTNNPSAGRPAGPRVLMNQRRNRCSSSPLL